MPEIAMQAISRPASSSSMLRKESARGSLSSITTIDPMKTITGKKQSVDLHIVSRDDSYTYMPRSGLISVELLQVYALYLISRR